MRLTVLFDLDDTLLFTNMDRFLPSYFDLLGKALIHLGPKDKIIQQVQYAVKQMIHQDDPGLTLKEVFDQHFYAPLGTTEGDCQDILAAFYREEFPKLQNITQPKPEAKALIDWCLSQGIIIAIATNPLFPRTATHQRIQWAGLDPAHFSFYTTYDDFHFTKPHLAYYAEIFGRLGWPEGTAVMIGDSYELDLEPVQSLGFGTYLIDYEGLNSQSGGQLSEVKPWLIKKSRNTSHLKNTFDSNLAVLQSTPAVLDTWLRLPTFQENLDALTPEKIRLLVANLEAWGNAESNLTNCFFQLSKHRAIEIPLWVNNNITTSQNQETVNEIHQLFSHIQKVRKANLEILRYLKKNDYEINTHSGHSEAFKATIDQIHLTVAQDRALLHSCVNLLNIYKTY